MEGYFFKWGNNDCRLYPSLTNKILKEDKRNTYKLFFLLFYAGCQFILNRKTRFTKTFCFMLLNVFSYV